MDKPLDKFQNQFTSIWQQLNAATGDVIGWLPQLLAAALILLIAYLVGKGFAFAVRFGIGKTSLGKRAHEDGEGLGEVVGRAVFWATILVALPAVLGVLGLTGLVEPLQKMVEQFVTFLPNLIGAILIFGIGWAVASVVKRAIVSVLEAAQADSLAERAGLVRLTGQSGITNFLGVLAFTLLIVPIAIAALDTLSIDSIAAPATRMLSSFLQAIPNIFAAAIVLLLAFVIGRFASETLVNLLPTLGIDRVGERLGLNKEVLGRKSLSYIAGYLAFLVTVIFGMIEAAKLLDFVIISDLLAEILTFGGHILLGSVIIAFGVIAADFIHGIVVKSKDAKPMAGFIKVAIIVLAAAIGLRHMGVANEIIHIGFGLMMGALAVGGAIAIGWGGKDTAGRLLEKWTKNL